jgi:hypothetical protein
VKQGLRSGLGLLAAFLLVTGCDTRRSSAPVSETAPSTETADSTPEAIASREETLAALAAFERMSAFLGAQARLRFEADVSWDVAQPGGEVLEFGGWREVALVRPDRVFAESQDRNGGTDRVIFDGTTLTVALLDLRLYAQTEQPGDFDAALDHLESKAGVPTPLSDLIQADLYGVVAERIEQARQIGRALVGDVACGHYWFRSADTDFELWIAEGADPLPRRMVIRYRGADSRPTFRALFSGWDLAPELGEADFAFIPAEGSKAVGFETLLEVLR